jgi:hypothetical protein
MHSQSQAKRQKGNPEKNLNFWSWCRSFRLLLRAVPRPTGLLERKMPQLTEQDIRDKSGSFDLAAVFRLKLDDLGLDQALHGCINGCVNVETVSVRNNKLTDLSNINGRLLVKLRSLDVSCNALKSLNSLRSCPGIQHLHAQGNQISSLAELKSLSHNLPSLITLYLQDSKRVERNPVCSQPGYLAEIKKVFPNLELLDGELLERKQLVSEVPEISTAEAFHIPQEELQIEDWFQDQNTTVKPLKNTEQAVQKLLGPKYNAVKSQLGECTKLSRDATTCTKTVQQKLLQK